MVRKNAFSVHIGLAIINCDEFISTWLIYLLQLLQEWLEKCFLTTEPSTTTTRMVMKKSAFSVHIELSIIICDEFISTWLIYLCN